MSQTEGVSFADLIRTMGRGSFGEEATDALQALVREITRIAATSGGKPKGQITVTFKLAFDRGIMEVEPSIQVKAPASVRARTFMYPSPEGRLSRNDTRQGSLALAESQDVSTAEVRDIRSMQTPA